MTFDADPREGVPAGAVLVDDYRVLNGAGQPIDVDLPACVHGLTFDSEDVWTSEGSSFIDVAEALTALETLG